jgi:hypothetical protein
VKSAEERRVQRKSQHGEPLQFGRATHRVTATCALDSTGHRRLHHHAVLRARGGQRCHHGRLHTAAHVGSAHARSSWKHQTMVNGLNVTSLFCADTRREHSEFDDMQRQMVMGGCQNHLKKVETCRIACGRLAMAVDIWCRGLSRERNLRGAPNAAGNRSRCTESSPKE